MNGLPLKPAAIVRGRIQSLDGLRAISITLVLLAHTAGTRNAYQTRHFDAAAHFGVRIFFLISGFLITSLLMREYEKSDSISLTSFYARRALRILPVLYAYLLVVAIFSLAGVMHLQLRDLITALTFTTDFRSTAGYVTHFWSLATEEQFYFLWPALLVLLGIKRSMKLAVLAVLLSPLASELASKPEYGQIRTFFVSVSTIATGCLLAGFRPRLHASTRYMRFLASNWSNIAGALAVLLDLWEWRGAVPLYDIGAVCGAIFIDRAVTFEDAVTRFLNSKPVTLIGLLSYSIYVWQPIFLVQSSDWIINSFPLNVVLVFICSIASFLLIERPLLRLKRTMKVNSVESEPHTNHFVESAAGTPS